MRIYVHFNTQCINNAPHLCKKTQTETDFQEHPGHIYFSVLERVINDEIIFFRVSQLHGCKSRLAYFKL